MNEPGNHAALVDKFDGTWVRVDECPARNGGTWWPLTDGPGWEARAQNGVGQGRPWSWLDDYHPFTVADAERTARALRLVREEYAR